MYLNFGGDAAAIVGSTVALSRKLGLAVIAEGIEDEPTVEALITMGCEEGQGCLFGRPKSANKFEQKMFVGANVTSSSVRTRTVGVSAA
jgi:EAL domain-containing protein (putative c-di-GMP-specific phosphodiesterase class I)